VPSQPAPHPHQQQHRAPQAVAAAPGGSTARPPGPGPGSSAAPHSAIARAEGSDRSTNELAMELLLDEASPGPEAAGMAVAAGKGPRPSGRAGERALHPSARAQSTGSAPPEPHEGACTRFCEAGHAGRRRLLQPTAVLQARAVHGFCLHRVRPNAVRARLRPACDLL
jgi:hypothetical protein